MTAQKLDVKDIFDYLRIVDDSELTKLLAQAREQAVRIDGLEASANYWKDKYDAECAKLDEQPDAPLHGECQAEIDRLNAEVAMLRDALVDAAVDLEKGGRKETLKHAKEILADKSTLSDWLAAHDAKVRDDALEEAAIRCEYSKSSIFEFSDEIVKGTATNVIDSCVRNIRAMKGTK
jgi:hypothetical protein